MASRITSIGTEHLHYQKIGRSFFAEISELPNFRVTPLMSIVSHKTGAAIELELIETKRDRENDIIGWTYKPVNDARITRVVILND